MLVSKVQPGEVLQLVDAFKSEGTFDKLRRQIFSTIAATERYQNVASDAEHIVDDLLKTCAADLTINQARDILRKKLFGLYSSQYGIMIAQGLDADEMLCNLLEEIGHSVDSFLGITKAELIETSRSQQPNEDHEVCDMEIDSDSEQSQQNTLIREVPLSEIALPPTNPNMVTALSFPQTAVVKPPPSSRFSGSFRRSSSMASTVCTDEVITAKSKTRLTHSSCADAETSFTSYQTQKIVTKKFYSNSRAVVSSKRYMASAVEYRSRRRRRAYNDDYLYY